ncbi:hypothetical protein KFU94_37725 [Chloroflexi bacterium TSY]|nr:hypothetical protein [Chloroflexi bacterium TSY]
MISTIVIVLFLSSFIPATLILCACAVSGATRGGGYQFDEESSQAHSNLQELRDVIVSSSSATALGQDQRLSHALDLAA